MISVWGSTNPTYGMSSIMIFPKASKDITRKPDEPAVMAVKASASLFMPIKTCRNWKNSCRENLWRNRRSVSSCFWRLLLMPKLPYVDGKSCCTISVKNTWKKIVEIVIIV